ncbi:MAG: hypothetical protein HYV26_22635 [Candidatus Hydrogenedentes bacterium]|nr:hypothetical protein [Candidatus Hydrogenedentota bacterium]
MYEISLTTAVVLYSSIVLFGGLGIWLYMETSTHHTYRVLEQQYLWRCVFCTYTYLDEAAERVSRCPRCHSLNSIEDAGVKLVQIRQPAAATLVPAEPGEPPRRNPSRQKRPGARRRGPRRRR